ncbi:unnamed protein product [Soboliphyme baturini]|uniref:ABC transmembrane type-1 domain-containing protein n=1 Tax=Soboliphyme baturini TaxID=241478 RepID=A0A183IZ55_9BILA|nr:unnamed protein product [Soboliphyme baturini]
MEATNVKLRRNPERTAGFFSQMFFWCLLLLGYKKPLQVEDLRWNDELAQGASERRNPLLYNAVRRVFGQCEAPATRFVRASLSVFYYEQESVKVLQLLLMGRLIRFFRFDSGISTSTACLYALGLSLCSFSFALTHHRYFYEVMRTGMRVRIALAALVYSKVCLYALCCMSQLPYDVRIWTHFQALSLSGPARQDATVGKIINLLSNDVGRFDETCIFLHYFWAAPLSLLGFALLLYYEMGVSCFAGFSGLLILVPIQGFIGRQMGKYR